MPRKTPVHHYTPTTGVRDDFLSVMNEFLELKTVRFSEFSEIWRSKKMSYLCAGRNSDREAREFLERAFVIALDFFLPPYQFQVRVGGLYLLYSLYMTQPIVPGVKVRVTQGQWRDTMRFQQEAAQQNHLDVVYIFKKMLQDHAFQFCFTASEMSSRAHRNETESSGVDLAEDMKEERRDIDRLFNYEAMEQLSYLMDYYQQMKVNLAGPEATQPNKSLDVVQGKMVEDLVSMLQSFKTSAGNIMKYGKAEPETRKSQKEQEQPAETTGSRRQALKARAFSEVTKSGGRSTFVISIDGDGSTAEESQKEVSPDHQSRDSETTSSNIVTNKERASRQLEASVVSSLTSKMEENKGKKNNPRMEHGSPKFKLASDSPGNADDVICVEVYSKSSAGSTNVWETGGQGQSSSTSFDHHIHGNKVSFVMESPEPNKTKEAQIKGALSCVALASSPLSGGKKNVFKEIKLRPDYKVKELQPVVIAGKNIKSHEFQSKKVDPRCYISVAGGKGTRVNLPAFEIVDYDDPSAKSPQDAEIVSDDSSSDSSSSGSEVSRSKGSFKKGIGKQPKMLDSAVIESGENRGQQLSEKLNSRTIKKERKGERKESASTNEPLSKSHSKAKSQSSKNSNKKKVSTKESRDSSDEGSIVDNKSKSHCKGKSSTSKLGKEAAVIRRIKRQSLTQTSEKHTSHSPSNEVNKVKRKRKASGENIKTPVNGKDPKSPLIETSVRKIECHSTFENFKSPPKMIRVIEQKVAAINSVNESNELRGTGIPENNKKKKIATTKALKEKQKSNELEMKSSHETSSKRKRSSRESDEHSFNKIVMEDGASPPKKTAPSKRKRKCLQGSPVKGYNKNSDLPKEGKKASKKSPMKGNDTNSCLSRGKTSVNHSPVTSVTGDKTKSNQTNCKGKSGASSSVTVQEILVYREPNKATIFKDNGEYTYKVPETKPEDSTGPKKASKGITTHTVEVMYI